MNNKYWIIGTCIGVGIAGVVDRIFFKPKRDKEQKELEEQIKRDAKNLVDSMIQPKIEEAKKDWDKIINSGEPIKVDKDFDIEGFKKEFHQKCEDALQMDKAKVERLKMSAEKLCLDFNEMEKYETIDGQLAYIETVLSGKG